MADTPDNTPAEAAEAEEEGRTRLPRVVVRMSDAMKAAVDAFCEENKQVATALARQLLADHIKYDLSKDPEAPGSGTRTKYADDASREAGKLRNRKRTSLLRKALNQMHLGGLHKRPALVAAAVKAVTALADSAITSATMDEIEKEIDAAIAAGK